MSYSIIFETKFIKLSDGRFLHLERSGCNNDNAGREKDEFQGEIYTEETLRKHIKNFTDEESKSEFELMIGSRRCNYHEYGKHLERMAKRAILYNDFITQRYFSAIRYDGVEVYGSELKRMTPEEFSNYWYSATENFRYKRILTELRSEEEIVKALENKDAVNFEVGKKYKIYA